MLYYTRAFSLGDTENFWRSARGGLTQREGVARFDTGSRRGGSSYSSGTSELSGSRGLVHGALKS